VSITWIPLPGAAAYNVYGRTAGAELLMTPTPVPASQTLTFIGYGTFVVFTDTGAVTPSGALPSANTTGAIQTTGQLKSTISTGTAPLSVTSITPVANLGTGLGGTTSSIGGSALTLGQTATGTVSVSGASAAVAAGSTIIATPVTQGDPGAGFVVQAYLSGSDTITVSVICIVAGTPTATTYNVKVIH
jgi:hypothetical protein